MSLARNLSVNFAIQSIGRILSILLGVVMLGILTRSLGPSGYGEYTTAITFLQLFGVLVDFGLTLTLVAMISEAGADEPLLANNILGLRFASAAILFGLAPLAVLPFPWSHDVKLAVAVGSVAYFFMSGATLLVGIYQKHQAIWRAVMAELLSRVVLVALIIALASGHGGVVAMIGATVIANLLWLVFSIRFARPFLALRPAWNWHVWKRVLSRSWPIAVSIFFNLLYLRGDILMLAYFRSQTEVGFYGASYRFLDVVTAIPTMFMGLLLPHLTQRWSEHAHEDFARYLRRTFDLFMTLAIPILVGGEAIALPLIRLVAGNAFDPAAAILRILIIATIGLFLGALFGHTVVAVNKQRAMIFGYISTAVLSLLGYFVFVPTYGAAAAAWVTIFSEWSIAILTFVTVYRASHVLPNLSVTLKAAFASLIMFFVLHFIPEWNALILIAIGGGVYGLVMLAIGGIRPKEIKQLLAKV